MRGSLLQIYLVIASLISIAFAGFRDEQLLDIMKTKTTDIKVLPLTDENYETVLNGKRDYHLVVLFTSENSKINCVLCREINPAYEIIANSWYQDNPEGITDFDPEDKEIAPKNIYFFRSDYDSSKKLFALLQLNSIPKIFYFRPTNALGPNNFQNEKIEYQFFQGDHRYLMIDWFSQLTGHKFNLHIPVDKSKVIINIVWVLSTLIVIKKFNKKIIQLLRSKLPWTIISLMGILLFVTGYMFNQIRGSPYVIEHPDGRVEYFLAGQQNQLGVETQIISFIYGALSLLFIILIKRAPEIKNDSVGLILVGVVSALIFALFSLLLSIYGLKGLGFPYKFIKFF